MRMLIYFNSSFFVGMLLRQNNAHITIVVLIVPLNLPSHLCIFCRPESLSKLLHYI